MALPLVQCTEPVAPKKENFDNKPWTQWERIDLRPKTPHDPLKNLLGFFQKKYQIRVTSISVGSASIYMDFQDVRNKEKLETNFVDIVVQKTKKIPGPHHQIHCTLCFSRG